MTFDLPISFRSLSRFDQVGWPHLWAFTSPRMNIDATDITGDEWSKLGAAARRHGLLLALNRHGAVKTMPPHVQSEIMRTGILTLVRTRTLLAIMAVLENAGIPAAAFKGPALSQILRGSPGARDPGDLDVLTPPAHVGRAMNLLQEQLGLRIAHPFDGIGPQAGLAGLLHATNAITLHAPECGTTVELHWRWFHNPYFMPMDPDRVWGAENKINLAGRSIGVPDPVEHLIYLCAHAARDRWRRLKWLDDIRHTVVDPTWIGGPDAWQGVAQRAHELGNLRAVAAAVHAACLPESLPFPAHLQSTLDASLKRSVLSNTAQLDSPESVPSDSFISMLDDRIRQWNLAPNWRNRLLGVLWRLVLAPTVGDVAALPKLGRHAWLLTLLRPALLLSRRMKRTESPSKT